jgi:hypothetical protein
LTQSSPQIDTTAPAAPAISSDTVSGNVVKLNGAAEANSTITVFDNLTQLGTATTNGSGAWTFTTGALASGSQSFTAKATDGAGNVSPASSALVVSLAPTPTVTGISESPATGDLNAGKTVALTVDFSENVTVAGGTPTLTLNDGGTATYASGSGGKALTFNYTVAAGQNTPDLMVSAVNLPSGVTIKDNSGTAANLSLSGLTQSSPQIDTTAPAAPAISSDTVSGNVVKLNGTAEANSTITVFDNLTQLGTATTNSSGAWTFTTGALASGSQSFTAKATDGAGNTSPVSSALVVSLAGGSSSGSSGGDSGSTSGGSGSSGGNLVANGSFETGSLSGWTLGGNYSSGQIFVDTNAEGGSKYAAGMGSMGSDGTLSQAVATTPGKTYTLSFWLQNEGSGGNDFAATWNGQTLLSLTNAAQSGYKQYTYTVTATGSSSKLEFSAQQNPSQWDLDNVSLVLPALTSETVAINGATAEGQALAAKVTDNDTNATLSYQWQYENGSKWTNIVGATASTFTVGVPQEGEMLRVVATAADGATTLSATSSATTAVKAAAPVLTIANNSLSVTAGGNVALGVSVAVPEAGDMVNVSIAGLPSYETITDGLDSKVFAGTAVTLTGAEVDSGLSLNSSYTGTGHPVAILTLTATNGASSAALTTTTSKTLTVTDPPSQVSASDSLDLANILLTNQTAFSHWEQSVGTGGGLAGGRPNTAAFDLLMQHEIAGFSNLTGDGASGHDLDSAWSLAGYSSSTASSLSHA